MSRAARALIGMLTALLLPACNLTYVPDQGGGPGGSSDPPFILVLPLDGDLQVPTNPEFAWNALAGATGYELQISTAPDFSQILWDDSGLTIT